MAQVKSAWNPVEGLEQLPEGTRIKANDVVVVRWKEYDGMSQDMDWVYGYAQYVPWFDYGAGVDYFLVERGEIAEPLKQGTIVTGESKEGGFEITPREFLRYAGPTKFGSAWVDTRNGYSYEWYEVLEMIKPDTLHIKEP